MKKIAVMICALCLCNGLGVVESWAQEKTHNLNEQKLNLQQYEQLKQIMLEGTPDELKRFIDHGVDVDGVYQCDLPLNMAIKSLAYALGSATGYPPEYALQKVKILIDAGAEINKEPCMAATPPLVTTIQLPLEMYKLEEAYINALKQEMKEDTGVTSCLSGMIPKPCKELTFAEKNEILQAIQEAYAVNRKALFPHMMAMLQLLIDNGADVNFKEAGNKTPLHRTASLPKEEGIEVLTYLIEKGADVNAQDIDGNTPLFFAFASDNKAAVNELIGAGADTTLRNNDGLLYNQVMGNIEDIYVDKDGNIRKDTEFGARHNL